MAFSGGVFTRLYNWVADRDSGIKIRADRMDAELDGIATGLSSCILKDGTQTVTADIPFGGNKLTGVGDPTAAQDAGTKNYIDTRFADDVFNIYDNADNTKKAAFQASGISTGTTRTYVLPDKDGTVAVMSDISTSFSDAAFRIQNDGDNTKQLALQLSGLTTATTRTLTVPDKDGTIATTADIGSTFSDSLFRVQDNGDVTKQFAFELSGITTSTTRTVTMPDSSGTLLLEETLASYIHGLLDLGSGVDLTSDKLAIIDATDSSLKTVNPEDISGGGTWAFLGTTDFSNDSTDDLTQFDSSTFDAYAYVLQNAIPASDAVIPYFRTSTDGGSTFDSAGSDYSWIVDYVGVSSNSTGSGFIYPITSANYVGSDTGEDGISGIVYILGPHIAKKTIVVGQLCWIDHNGIPKHATFMGMRNASEDVDGFRFGFTTGNIESGTGTFYGIKNA